MSVKPITPKEFKEAYGKGVPDIVIETVNELLKEASSHEWVKRIVLKQNVVVDALVLKGIDRQEIFDKHYLDFEPVFRKAGWKVDWNNGAYFEEDGGYWVFSF